MDDATKEAIANLANALVISYGVLVDELDRAGTIEARKVSQHLRRRIFDAVETGADPNRHDLRWLEVIAGSVDGALE